ncbi:MAG: CBS domain-containing protein [Ignavibacteriaceae bacterium]|jgi:CBS domain-containing protein|nr:CBS domain-containing protein [Ignavibacteriaceae bacterium]
MKTVKEIIESKEKVIWSVTPDTTVYNALKLMAEKGIGAVLVIKDSKVVGIMSERDYARKVVLQGKSSVQLTVSEIMSDKVMFVDISQNVEECMALMINKRIRHLPIFDGENLVGFISIGDVVKAIIDEKEFFIDQLVNYIKDTPPIK